jgi:hypothetical protein
MKGGGVIDYPWLKLRLNRMSNRLPAHGHRRLPPVAFGAL